MSYTKTTWVNDQAPAINATNLNNIEDGIADVDSRTTTLEGQVTNFKTGSEITTEIGAAVDDLSGVTDASTARSNLSVYSTSEVNALVDDLSGVSNASGARSNLGVYSTSEVNALVDDLSGVSNASGARSNLGLVIGTDVLAYSAYVSYKNASETRSASINMADNTFQRPKLIDYSETVNALGTVGASPDVDLEDGNVITATVSTTAPTFTFSNPPASGSEGSFTLILTNGAASTITWPTSVDWEGGTAPTLTASGIDILVFTTIDAGTTWYGFLAGKDIK